MNYLILSLLCLLSVCQAQDLTRQPFAHGSEVVEAVIDLIRENCIFPQENRFLRRWAYIKTRDGTLPFKGGYTGGIWKIDRNIFEGTKNDTWDVRPTYGKIYQLIGRNWLDVQWQELVKPLYSGLAAVLVTVQQMNSQSIPFIPPEVELQANLWERYFRFGDTAYNYTTTVNLMNKGCQGNEAIDMMFIIDSSSSVNPNDLLRVKVFMTKLVGEFEANGQLRVAIIRYSTQVYEAISFHEVTTNGNIISLINGITFESGGTNTAGALDTARSTFKSARSDAVKVAVLITDGKSDDFISTQHAADNLKAEGIAVFTVGVGNLVDQTELDYVASEPACTHTYTVADFKGISALLEEIQHSVCRAPLYANTTVTCEIGRCPPYAFPLPSIGLTIQANITCGGVTVYSSVSQAYPGVAANDRQVVVQYGNMSEFYQPGVENQTYIYVKPDDRLLWGNGPCELTLTPIQGQIRHTVYIYCEENGVRRNCTEEELCPGGKIHNTYNPCTEKNLATGKTKFPYPGDNTKFYTCDRTLKAYVSNCPTGEIFAPNCELCYGKDQPVITNCNPSLIDSKFDIYCTPENIRAGKFYFTHPTDIHLYIQCDPWGRAYVMPCELDYIWQETKLSCEKRGTLINPCLNMQNYGNGRFYAYPPDFHKFIECNDFLDPLVLSCPAGLMWSDCIKTCMQRSKIPDNCFIDPNGPLASYISTSVIPSMK